MSARLSVLFLFIASVASAQPAPLVGTTLRTTSTAAGSVRVGCTQVGTCTGGIDSGPIAATSIVGTTGTFSSALSGLSLVIGGGTSITSSSNIALLSAANVFTTGQSINASAAANGLALSVSGTTHAVVGLSGRFEGDSTTDLGLFGNTGNGIRFYTAGSSTERFAINAAGDWLRGAAIMDSTGTPTITSGGGTSPAISGTDYAFRVNTGSTNSTTISIQFGHTWTSNPICVANSQTSPLAIQVAISSQTQMDLAYASGQPIISVLCRSF